MGVVPAVGSRRESDEWVAGWVGESVNVKHANSLIIPFNWSKQLAGFPVQRLLCQGHYSTFVYTAVS